ncbi:MAG: nucleotide sugar dehydrogenase [Elusimicrobia bacterium]|nr:nucleotide sugar dehydrogenase [Elusimicrobiota bacterium]
MFKKLETGIGKRDLQIAVIGMGYVGLPLALAFARQKFTVHGIDADGDRVGKLRDKKSYITDVSDRDIATPVAAGRLVPSTDFSSIRDCRAVIICVPTPIKKRYTPDMSFILSAVREVRKYLQPGTLVVLESTTYPGTTEEVIRPLLETAGLKVGRNLFLAFSPERIDPGNAAYDVTRIPKVVGGVTPACCKLTALLYGTIIRKVHVVSSPAAAEMTKLLENTFRIVNIGWVNEAAMMCHRFGIDIWEVINAAKTKPFGFMPFYPGLGVGGHCIPEDPIYLYWKAKKKGHASRFIKLAADVNAAMPEYTIGRIADLLKARGKVLKGARVLVLGVTYKKDVKDLRKSPSLKLIEALGKAGADVGFYDPIIPGLHINGIHMAGLVWSPGMIRRQDIVVVAVDHTAVDYNMLRRNAKMIFDARNVYGNVKDKKIVKL